MRVNKKRIIVSAFTVGAAAALLTGGTIAYFTDQKSVTNHFTVGNVEISVYESQLHRQNSGRGGSFTALASDTTYCDYTIYPQEGISYNSNPMKTYESAKYCTPGMDAYQFSGLSAVENGHTVSEANGASHTRNWGYADATIIADAATYKTGYFATVSENLVPGRWVRKFTYVKNEGKSDTYVRIRYVIPESLASKLTLSIPGTPYTEHDTDKLPYMTALNADGTAYTGDIKSYTGYTRGTGTDAERVYEAVVNEALKPGEMTFWSPVNTIKINDGITETIADFDVKVEVDAIQAWGFADAITAFENL